MRRWGALSGIGFVLLFALGAAVYGNGAGSDEAEIVAYYARASDRAHQLAGFAIVTCAAVLFAVFAVTLGARLGSLAGAVVAASGTLSAGLLLAANTLWSGSAWAVALEQNYQIDPSTHLLLEDTGYAFFVASAAAAVPLVLAVCADKTLPGWLRWAAVPAIMGLVFSVYYVPYAIFLLWVAAAAVWASRPVATPRDG
ncbi:MAG TPA: hypothetical protein VHI14_06705 [Jatrophihabitantaceae bacterium]|nr:hypothetical protein [Jatrophihabitantaceae bacterium]